MYHTDGELQYTPRVDSPNPLFAHRPQQAIGGLVDNVRDAMR